MMRPMTTTRLACAVLGGLLIACGSGEAPEEVPTEGVEVAPPFAVRGDAEGLLLTWFDADGTHVAERRGGVPEEHRHYVRVDDLNRPPEERLDPAYVYVADLREAGEGGAYAVRQVPRETFDARVTSAQTPERPETDLAAVEEYPGGGTPTAPLDADIVIYGASWCSACRAAESYLRGRGIPFVERDIEREPGARQAMMEAAERAGVSPTGIPVIDVGGRVLQGFNREALDRAILESQAI